MDDDKLRLIKPTKAFLKSGVEHYTEGQEEKMPTSPSFLQLFRADVAQNNIIPRMWAKNKLALLSMAAAPTGWSPRDEIKGVFTQYEEFLAQAKNPMELEYRKQMVVQQINYNRMLAKSGILKSSLASMAACFLDPITYVSFGIAGKLGANAVRTGALAMGMGRVTTGAVHGAVLTAAANVIETPVRRALGASPENPEYHVVSAALGGALFGAAAGQIGKSLSYSRFRINEGAKAETDFGFKVFEKADLAKQQFQAGIHPLSKTPEGQIEFKRLLHENIDKYLKWEQPGQTGEVFTFEELGAKTSDEAFAYSLGWGSGKGAKAITSKTADLLDWIGSRLSNQKTLLTSDSNIVKSAGFKIWETNYSDRNISNLVGDAEPLNSYVNRNYIGHMNRYQSEVRDMFKQESRLASQQNRPAVTREASGEQVVRAAFTMTPEEIANSQDPLFRARWESADRILNEAGSVAHENGVFEFQRRITREHEDRLKPLTFELSKAEKRLAGLKNKSKAGEALGDELKEAQSNYDAIQKLINDENAAFKKTYDSFTLERAKERFGGNYMPARLSADKLSSDFEGSHIAIQNAIVSGANKEAKRLSGTFADISKTILEKDQSLLVETDINAFRDKFWKAFQEEASRRYVDMTQSYFDGINWHTFDIYENPISKDMTVPQAILAMREGKLRLSDTFQSDYASRAAEIVYGDSITKGFKMRTNVGDVGLEGTLDSVLLPEGYTPYDSVSGSLRMRSPLLDYSQLVDYLDTDLDKLVDNYVRNVYGAVGMKNSFGDTDGTLFREAFRKSVGEEEFAILQKGGADAKAKVKALRAQRDREYRAMSGAIDHILGQSAISWGNIGEESAFKHALGTISNWNVARYLSDCVFSQLQDVANVSLAQDGWRTFGSIFKSGFKTIFSPKLRSMYKQEMIDYGIGGSLWLENMRSKPLLSISEETGAWAKAERVSGKVAEAAVKYSGVPLLDAHTQCAAAYLATQDLRRMGERLSRGVKLTNYQARLAQDYNLDVQSIKSIYQQINTHGKQVGDAFFINTSKWSDRKLANRVQQMMHKIGTDATMIPAAELPMFFKTPVGKMILQFKSFTTATFSKMFVPAFENGTTAATNTMLQCIILGTMGKLCKAFGKWTVPDVVDPVTGKRRPQETADIIKDCFYGSVKDMDIFAWCSDPTGVFDAVISGGFNHNSIGGAADSILRDVAGGIRWIGAQTTGGQASKADTKALMRMLPFQNYWLTRLSVSAYRNLFKNQEDNQ